MDLIATRRRLLMVSNGGDDDPNYYGDGSLNAVNDGYERSGYSAKILFNGFNMNNQKRTEESGYRTWYSIGNTYTTLKYYANGQYYWAIDALTDILYNDTQNATSTGTFTFNLPSTQAEQTYYIAFGATTFYYSFVTYQDVQICVDNTWMTLKEAVDGKKIKPLVPINIFYMIDDSTSPLTFTSAIYSGEPCKIGTPRVSIWLMTTKGHSVSGFRYTTSEASISSKDKVYIKRGALESARITLRPEY